MSQAILFIIFTSLFQVLNGRRDMISSPRFLEHPGEAESSSIVASSKNAKIFSLSVLAVSVSIYKQKNQSDTHIKLTQVVWNIVYHTDTMQYRISLFVFYL